MVRKKKRLITDMLMIMLMVAGAGVLMYPFVSDSVTNFWDQQIISSYQREANKENQREMAKIRHEMTKKNKELAEGKGNPGKDPFAKKAKQKEKVGKDYYQAHTIGIITIPKINVRLPIFDRTTETLLNKGSSLLEGTSYPTGGNDTHAVITGHRGLPQAKLFTDLPDLVKGDVFYIEIGNDTLAYKVDQIKVIVPTETQDLLIEKEQDLVTLLTCTPYMVNSHRVLVRGHRIPYESKQLAADLTKVERWQQLVRCGLVLLGAVLMTVTGWLVYRVWFAHQISNRTYQLSFHLVDREQTPKTGITFTLYTKNGRHPIFHDSRPVTAVTDQSGLLLMPTIKGGKYMLKSAEVNVGAFIKRRKDTHFSLQRSRKRAYTMITAGKSRTIIIK